MNLDKEDPVLYLGLDLGIKRDTTGLAAICRDYQTSNYLLWGLQILPPPVNILVHVEPVLFWLLRTKRVACLSYDEYQMAATTARLEAEGYGNKLNPINQQTALKSATNTLSAHCQDKQLILYPDLDLRSQFSWTAVRYTERGPHIQKQNQAKRIDGVVAIAMALLGATEQTGFALHPSYSAERHGRSAVSLP